MFSLFTNKALIVGAMFIGTTTALFDCNADQHAFSPSTGNFVVHYTSIRDTDFQNSPWVRICLPNGDKWTNVEPLATSCDADPAAVLGTDKTQLHHDLVVTNGNGCDKGSSNLNGASITYNNQVAVLQASNGRCGDRDHGISCEFTID